MTVSDAWVATGWLLLVIPVVLALIAAGLAGKGKSRAGVVGVAAAVSLLLPVGSFIAAAWAGVA